MKRQERIVRLPPSLRADHHLGTGYLHRRRVERAVSTALSVVLLLHHLSLLVFGPLQNARSFLRSVRTNRSHWVHHQRNILVAWSTLLLDLPIGADLRLGRSTLGLDSKHPCYRK